MLWYLANSMLLGLKWGGNEVNLGQPKEIAIYDW